MTHQWKGFISGFLCAVLAFSLFGTAAATVGRFSGVLDYKDIKVTLDGRLVDLVDADGNTVEPFAISGTTYLPVRAVSNALGLEVGWDAATSTVVLTTPNSGHTIYITRTGSKYHYDDHCNGGTYWEVPLSTAIGMGLKPCDKCVHD